MRWFSLIDSINLRDAYDPLRSTILILTFISHPSQRLREKPASLTSLDLIMSYIFPAFAMMERGSWSALL